MPGALQFKPCPSFALFPSFQNNDLCASFNHLLNSCTSLSTLKQIHSQLLIHGLSNHLALGTKLLSVASLTSSTIDYARKLFDKMPQRDSFAWNSLIRGYADLGPCVEVPILYQKMHRLGLSPDHFTFPFVVRSCAVLSTLIEGKEAHCDVIRHGFDSNMYVQCSLITMYSCNGEVRDSEMVFCEMQVRNVVAWTAMISGYAQNGAFEKALGVFQKMVESKVMPNEITLVSVLPACEGIELHKLGKSIHGMVIKSGSSVYISLENALMAMYGKSGNVEAARKLFDRMENRSLVSWNTMIAVYEQNGASSKAVKLFGRMLTEKVKFDSVTLVSVVSACTASGALDTGRWAHELAQHYGLESDVRVGNALIDMYAKCGSLGSAKDIFTRLSQRGVVTWSTMIGAYAAHGQSKEVVELFTQMIHERVKPNSFTFTSVLAACSHSGLVEGGIKHFNSMIRDYSIIPTIEHCACMVDLLGRAGRLEDAYEFIKRMPVRPDSGIWGALLGACRIHGNVELAELVAEELFQLDPHNVTFFVLMSNIYAEASRWDDAARLRKMMKGQELKKTPGCSSLQRKRYHKMHLGDEQCISALCN